MNPSERREQPGEAAPHDAQQKEHRNHGTQNSELQAGTPALDKFITAVRRLKYTDRQMASLLRLKAQAQRLRQEAQAAEPTDGEVLS